MSTYNLKGFFSSLNGISLLAIRPLVSPGVVEKFKQPTSNLRLDPPLITERLMG